MENKEIDFKHILEFFKKNFKVFIFSFIIFLTLSFIYFYSFNIKYTTTNKILTTQSSSFNSPLSAFSNFGIDLNTSENIITDKIFYDIIDSDHFMIKLINFKIYSELFNEEYNNLIEYYNKTINNNEDNKAILSYFKSMIDYYYNNDKNILEINVTSHDPLLSKIINETITLVLNLYITEINQKSNSTTLSFLIDELDLAEKEYINASNKLILFQESNKNISNQKLNAIEKQLVHDFDLKFELFKNLQLKLQETQIKSKSNYSSLVQLFPIELNKKPNNIPFTSTLFYFIVSSFLFSFIYIFLKD